jgi:hypothetical protein
MKTTKILFAAAAMLAISSSAHAGSWSCSAKNMVTGRYDGGATAYIHLSGFNTGSNYPVSKSGSKVSGVTKNGTPFTCRSS